MGPQNSPEENWRLEWLKHGWDQHNDKNRNFKSLGKKYININRLPFFIRQG